MWLQGEVSTEQWSDRVQRMVAELDLEPLLVQRTTLDKITPVSTFPAVYQDIALVVPESAAAGEI